MEEKMAVTIVTAAFVTLAVAAAVTFLFKQRKKERCSWCNGCNSNCFVKGRKSRPSEQNSAHCSTKNDG